MKNERRSYTFLIIALACGIGFLLGTFIDYPFQSLIKQNESKAKLTRLIDYIENDYVDEVNTDSIVDVAIHTILKSLDPHSVYIPEGRYQMVSRSMNGDFVGIGIRFFVNKDTITVSKTIHGSPAEKAGIKPGDRILFTDGTQLYGRSLTNDSLISLLKGPPGSTTNLKIYRKGTDEKLNIEVTRAHVSLKSVIAAYLVCDELGYIKIDRFSATTSEEFHDKLQSLKEKGMTKLILDLRDNGGGYLEEAVKVVDEFLPEGKLIVYTKNNSGHLNKMYATEKGSFEEGKLFILINEKTASASEIVAGAIQDNDAGVIVGRRSFGKGLVQREMQLGDGSVVRLTVARYYTPTGRSIQRPYGKGRKEYFNEYLERYENGELISRDSIEVVDSLRFVTPGGDVVYGGGGIIPDVFVPLDLNYKREHLNYFLLSGIMNRFAFEQLDKNRSYYNNLSFQKFKKEVNVESKIDDFNRYLQSKSSFFTRHPIQYGEKYKPLFKKLLKASMAKQLFGKEAYYEILNHNDAMLKKVKELTTCKKQEAA